MASLVDTERQMHIQTLPEEVGRYVILAGDPGRIPVIAEKLDQPKEISYNREFNVYTGSLLGEKVTVCSTGIGGPSAAIAVEELIRCGADTFIRVGTSGGIRLDVMGGDLVIATAAVRAEGTSKEYLPECYPAAADYEVVNALVQAAEGLCEDRDHHRYHVGVVQSKDSFYGEIEPEKSAASQKLISEWESYVKCGCLTSEMECAAIFSVGLSKCGEKKIRCGGVLTALWNVERSANGMEDIITHDSTKAIECAVEAMKIIIAGDKK